MLPKYAEWLERFPSLHALAAADETHVTETWRPLGYNIRPKRLQAIAREAVARYDGRLPDDEETLLSFKGIGQYTAGAIRQLCLPATCGDSRHQCRPRALSRLCWRRRSEVARHEETLVGGVGRDGSAEACSSTSTRRSWILRHGLHRAKPKCLVCPMAKGCRTFPISTDQP